MRILLVLLTLSFTASTASASYLYETIVLFQSNVETFDPNIFAAGPNVDVYHLGLVNPNAGNVTALELSLPGTFVNRSSSTLSFRDTTDLPTLGPNMVAESFFVLPAGNVGAQLAVGTIDNDTILSSSYTLPGTTSLIDAGGHAVVAVLSIPTGSVFPNRFRFTGRAVIDGEFETIGFGILPEPSTALLIILGIAGIAVRHHS